MAMDIGELEPQLNHATVKSKFKAIHSTQSQFGYDQGGIQFIRGLTQLVQMNGGWECRSDLYETSLDEDYHQIDLPCYIYYGSLDDPALVEENILMLNSYYGNTYGNHFISSCSPTPMNSNSNLTTTNINGSTNEDEREISYSNGNDMVARFETASAYCAFDNVITWFI